MPLTSTDVKNAKPREKRYRLAPDVIERQLAHAERSKVRAAYTVTELKQSIAIDYTDPVSMHAGPPSIRSY